jgi:hypothetical protein
VHHVHPCGADYCDLLGWYVFQRGSWVEMGYITCSWVVRIVRRIGGDSHHQRHSLQWTVFLASVSDLFCQDLEWCLYSSQSYQLHAEAPYAALPSHQKEQSQRRETPEHWWGERGYETRKKGGRR